MSSLGANTIRVYHVDPTGNHDGCMSTFASYGIYLFLDLDTFDTQFEQTIPYWNQTQLSAFTAVLDAFHDYSNLAGVFVANEALTFLNKSDLAPFIKAGIRDVKAYRESKKYRPIPIGYAGADITELRPMLQNYLACSSDDDVTADFFALNVYEWCGKSSFKQSGYIDLVKNASSLQIPIFISETGCREPRPRLFDDQASIFGPDMSDSWSGAIIYEWIEEANNYGLISYGAKVDEADEEALDGYPRAGTPTPVSPDFSNLKKQWATLHPKGMNLGDYRDDSKVLTPVSCPSSTAGDWIVDAEAALPSLGQILDRATATPTPISGAGAAKPSESKKSAGNGRQPKIVRALPFIGLSALFGLGGCITNGMLFEQGHVTWAFAVAHFGLYGISFPLILYLAFRSREAGRRGLPT